MAEAGIRARDLRGRAPEQPGPGPVPTWLVVLFAGVAVALLPWAAVLNLTLPSRHVARHWDLAWTGFDLALAAGLLSVAVAAYRSSVWLPRLAMAAGTLLACDAWFDVLTSSKGTDLTLALVGAVVELPLAIVCFAVARRGETPAAV